MIPRMLDRGSHKLLAGTLTAQGVRHFSMIDNDKAPPSLAKSHFRRPDTVLQNEERTLVCCFFQFYFHSHENC